MRNTYAGIVLILILFLLSCEKTDPDSGNRLTRGEYIITITGTTETVLVGNDVTTNWDEESGLIYLGTDDNLEPIGTLTMNILLPSSSNNPIRIVSAIQSKTDVRVGTAAELNARNYVIREPSEDMPSVRAEITDWEIGTNYIKGTLYIDMERQLVYSTDEPEYVTLTGTFTAVD